MAADPEKRSRRFRPIGLGGPPSMEPFELLAVAHIPAA